MTTSIHFSPTRCANVVLILFHIILGAKEVNGESPGLSLHKRIVIRNVDRRIISVAPLLDSRLVENGADALPSEIGGIVGIAPGTDDELFAVATMGGKEQLFRITGLRSSPIVAAGGNLVDQELRIEGIQPNGLARLGNELLVPHDDHFITIYSDQGMKLSVIDSRPFLFEKMGDGLKALTLDPNGNHFWAASLVGQVKDGTRHTRLIQFNIETQTDVGLPQHVYILEAPYPGYEKTSQPSTQPSLVPSQEPSENPSQNPSSAPSSQPSPSPTSLFQNMSIFTMDEYPFESILPETVKGSLLGTSHVDGDLSSTQSEETLPRSGLVALTALDAFGNFLALERVQSIVNPVDQSKDFKVQLFYVETAGALDVSEIDLGGIANIEEIAVKKTLLLDFKDLNLSLGFIPNFESMASIPSDVEDTLRLVVASNNKYRPEEETYLLTVDLSINYGGIAEAKTETDRFVRGSTSNMAEFGGKAESAKVWVHPKNPAESLLVAAYGRGVKLFDMSGQVVLDLMEGPRTSWFSDLDIFYAFPITKDRLVDMVVVADARTNELKFNAINTFATQKGSLDDLTARGENATLAPLFAADFVAAYKSPYTGINYVFVGDTERSKILQLQLKANDKLQVETVLVRKIPLSLGEVTAMVVDQDMGIVFVAIQGADDVAGIYKFDAEPNPLSQKPPLDLVMSFHNSELEPPFTGLTMYYAGDEKGFLLASHPSSSSIFVYDRAGDHDFLGSFQVASTGGVVKSEGLSVLNANLGPEYSCGILVVQDSMSIKNDVEVQDNIAYNTHSNFKMIRLEDVTMYDSGVSNNTALQLDTQSWSPRRLALVILVDKIAEEVYVQMAQDLLPARTAQDLLEHLGSASFELYRPGSAMRKIMNFGSTPWHEDRRHRRSLSSQFDSSKPVEGSTPQRRNNLRGLGNIFQYEQGALPRCVAEDSNGEGDEYRGSFARAGTELKTFAWKVGDMIGGSAETTLSRKLGQSWIERVESILWALPEDVTLG